MRVLLLCSSAVKASQLFRDLAGVPGIDCKAIICHNQRTSVFTYLAKQAGRVVLGGPRAVIETIRLLATRRLHFSFRPFADEAILRWVREQQFDVGLHAMGVIYRRPMIDAFRLGILNAHIGMLPGYRGRSVMEWSLLEGEPTGITTFFIDEGIDTGNPIVVRRDIPLDDCANLDLAKRQLFQQDGAMYAEALRRLRDEHYEPVQQNTANGRRYYVMSSLLKEVASAALSPNA